MFTSQQILDRQGDKGSLVDSVWVDPSTRQQLPAHVLYVIVPSWRGRAGAGQLILNQHTQDTFINWPQKTGD